jgi:hypothetical protein
MLFGLSIVFVDFSLKALSDGKNKTDALYPGTHVLQCTDKRRRSRVTCFPSELMQFIVSKPYKPL